MANLYGMETLSKSLSIIVFLSNLVAYKNHNNKILRNVQQMFENQKRICERHSTSNLLKLPHFNFSRAELTPIYLLFIKLLQI